MKKTHSLAIVVPMYNEEKGALRCVDEIVRVIAKLKVRAKLITINDGSHDRTQAILERKKRQFPKHLVAVKSSVNQGYGAALQLGIMTAKQEKLEFVLFMDSDLTNDPKDITRFSHLMSSKVDCVKASRYMVGGGTVGVPLFRVMISTLGNKVASSLFALGISDCTNGFRMTRRALLDDIEFKENKFPFIMEELYELKRKRAKFMELPIVLTARKNSISNFRYSLKTFFDYGKYVLKAALV